MTLPLVFKLRSELRGTHVHTRVFAGYEGRALASSGVLVQTVCEWQEFGAILGLGAEQTRGRIKVVFEGDMEIVKALEERS